MGCAVHCCRTEIQREPLSKEILTSCDVPIDIRFSCKTSSDSFSDRYYIGHMIGSGRHSEVFSCTSIDTLSPHAAKVYKAKLYALTHGSYESLATELNIMLSLNHPNLLSVAEYFLEPTTLTLVVDYCDGGDLLQHLGKRTRFTENAAAGVIKQLLEAVAYLHDNRVMHRNLTPDSILFKTVDCKPVLKVAKFSHSATFKPGQPLSSQSGALSFMSPEMLRGQYSELCDEWQIGVLLYLLISGVPPFEDNRSGGVTARILDNRFNLKKGVWTRISPEAKDFIRALMSPEASRLTARAALTHPWIVKFTSLEEPVSPLPAESLTLVTQYQRTTELQSAASCYMQLEKLLSLDMERLQLALRAKGGECVDCAVAQQVADSLAMASLRPKDVQEALSAVSSAGQASVPKFLTSLRTQKLQFAKDRLQAAIDCLSPVDAMAALEPLQAQTLIAKLR